MKNRSTLLLFVALLSGSTHLTAQQSTPYIDSLVQLLKQAYNQQQPETLHAFLNVTHQPASQSDALAKRLQSEQQKHGTWVHTTWMYELNEVHYYTVGFEKERFILALLTDSMGKIRQYNLQPFYTSQLSKSSKALSNNPLATARDKRTDSLIRPYIQLQQTAGVCIALIEKNNIYTYSYGETKKGNQQLPNANTTLFEIGSNTKTFTGLLLAAAIVSKQVEPEEDIERFLPDSIRNLAFEGTPITLQTLANHTSGLPRIPGNLLMGNLDLNAPYNWYDSTKLLTFLHQFHPSRKPGTVFEYSNLGMGLLGQLLAWHQHTTYEALLQQTILQPLRLNNTRLTLTREDSVAHAQGYNSKNEPTPLWNMQSLIAAGGLHSTAADMARYIQANLGKAPASLLPAIQLAQQSTFNDGQNNIGLAWLTLQWNHHTIVMHNGATFGFRSFIAFDKEKEKGVVILTNCSEDVTLLGYQFMQ